MRALQAPLNPGALLQVIASSRQVSALCDSGHSGRELQCRHDDSKTGGGAFAANTFDPEGLRLNRATGTVFWTNKGQRKAAGFQAPAVREMTADGSHLRDFGFTVPTRYRPFGSAAGTAAADRSTYNNLAFESLALSADGKTLFTATENALKQDGLVSTLAHGTSPRLLSFDVASGASGAEYVVEVDKVAYRRTRRTALRPTA